MEKLSKKKSLRARVREMEHGGSIGTAMVVGGAVAVGLSYCLMRLGGWPEGLAGALSIAGAGTALLGGWLCVENER